MDREDDDKVKSDVPETPEKHAKDPEINETEKTSDRSVKTINNDKENIASTSSMESGESCSRMYLEDNKFETASPCGSGDGKKNGKHRMSTSERSKCKDSKETVIAVPNSSLEKGPSDIREEAILGETSKKLKKAASKSLEGSEDLDSSDICSTSKKQTEEEDGVGVGVGVGGGGGEMSFINEYGKTKRGISEGQEGDSRVSMDESKRGLDADSSKRKKSDESINGSSDSIDKDATPSKFSKLKSKVRKRNYRVKQNLPEDTAENEADELVASGSNSEKMEIVEADDSLSEQDLVLNPNEDSNLEGAGIAEDDEEEELEENSEVDDDGDERDDDDSNERTSASEDDSEEVFPPVLRKEQPKPQWFVVPEVIKRQLGCNDLFQRRFYGSLHTVQRLELMYKLKEHEGCVNTLSFNQRGNLLASGSDDLTVVIWDWPLGKKHHSFKTGHRSNVFQASWLPLPSENLMVTCARDGCVRLADLHKSSIDCSRRLATHKGPATKLTIHPDEPHIILSAGEDAKVFTIDVRQSKPTTLLTLKEGLSQIAIYSINSNPLNSNEFCLGGRDQFVRIYDKRKVSSPLCKLCPENLKNNKNHAHVTCAIYNYNGSEILASYNDEDIYLFDTLLPYPVGDFAHKYQGHRNNATVKGVNFFGPKSEFVISGSDCGNIFIWEKNTEAIVQWMPGDEYGVVNRLEPHPHIPVLATSGLDYDVKVWVPSCEEPPSMKNLETCVRYNMKSRARDVSREPDAFDGQLLWFLWRHATETQEPRTRGHGLGRHGDARDEEGVDTSSDDTSSNSNSPSEDDSDGGRPQCSPS